MRELEFHNSPVRPSEELFGESIDLSRQAADGLGYMEEEYTEEPVAEFRFSPPAVADITEEQPVLQARPQPAAGGTIALAPASPQPGQSDLSPQLYNLDEDIDGEEDMIPATRRHRIASIFRWLVTPRTVDDSDSRGQGSLNDPLNRIDRPQPARLNLVPMTPRLALSAGEPNRESTPDRASLAQLALPPAPAAVRGGQTALPPAGMLELLPPPSAVEALAGTAEDSQRRYEDFQIRISEIMTTRETETFAMPVLKNLDEDLDFFETVGNVITGMTENKTRIVADPGNLESLPLFKRPEYWAKSGQVLIANLLSDRVPGASEPIVSTIRSTIRMRATALNLSPEDARDICNIIDSETGWEMLRAAVESLSRGAANESLNHFFTNISIRSNGKAEHRNPAHPELPPMKLDFDNLVETLGLAEGQDFDRNQGHEFGFNMSLNPATTDALDKILERVGGVSKGMIFNLDTFGLGSFIALVPATGLESFNRYAKKETGGFIVFVHPPKISTYVSEAKKDALDATVSVWQLTNKGHLKMVEIFRDYATQDFVDPRPDIAVARNKIMVDLQSRIRRQQEVRASKTRVNAGYESLGTAISNHSEDAQVEGDFVPNVRSIVTEIASLMATLNGQPAADELPEEIREAMDKIVQLGLSKAQVGPTKNEQEIVDAEIVVPENQQENDLQEEPMRLSSFNPLPAPTPGNGNGHH